MAEGGGQGKSFIHRVGQDGARLWNELNFIVVTRPGYDLPLEDRPPHHRMMEFGDEGSSTTIRENIFRRINVSDSVDPAVNEYIERYGLYRGRIPNRMTHWKLDKPRAFLFADERNARAKEWREQYRAYEVPEKPNCILVFGGDGTMLRAIRKYANWRVPLLGLNAGHLGFLLNQADTILDVPFPPQELLLRQLPFLYV